jgi:ribosomal protein S8
MYTGNHLLSDLVAKLNFGAIRRLRFIKVKLNDTSLEVLKILYKQGAIRSFLIKDDKILVYYKYYLSRIAIKISIISKPGNRIY